MSFPVVVNTEEFRKQMKKMKDMAQVAPVYIHDANNTYVFASQNTYEAQVESEAYDRMVTASFERGMQDINEGRYFKGSLDDVLDMLSATAKETKKCS